MKTYKVPALLIVLAFLCSAVVAGNDPGNPDTVKIEGGPLAVDQSRPIALTIVNDYPVGAFSLQFQISTVDEGFARFDSAVYIGRLADPAIYSYRLIEARDNDENSPDTLVLAGLALGTSLPLPPGDDPVMELYYTGLSTGQIEFDSIFVPPAAHFEFVNTSGYTYPPKYVDSLIAIGEGTPAPILTLSQQSPQITTGTGVEIDVSTSSPVGFPVTMELVSLVGYDDETRDPINTPGFGSGNPAAFNWTPDGDDIGIWEATFRACDSAGTCTDISTDIQVVQGSTYLLSFDYSETPDSPDATGILHGNFDDDPNPEVFIAGTTYWYTYAATLYDYASESGFGLAYYYNNLDFPALASQLGYFDGDELLDVVMTRITPSVQSVVLSGDGDNSFSVSDFDDPTSAAPKGGTIGEFTRDGYIDYATVQYNGVNIYAGGSDPLFDKVGFVGVSGEAMSVNSADFNGDGYDDLAIGTDAGVNIYLGDSVGGFNFAHFYSQLYGSLDIVVTNEGSDFDNDGNYDLCISTPSVGGAYSEMVVYLGNGDGSFEQNVILTVKGQIFGNRVGDINNDGELDIVYVNGAKEYAAILFGDGDGSFTNELRYDIAFRNPRYIDCFDVDLDGDLDIAVNANRFYPSNSLFLLKNDLDPGEYSLRSLAVTGVNNVELELVSASGRQFNNFRNTMPTGQYFKRNIDRNSIIDEFAVLSLVEEGAYSLVVSPKADCPIGEPFTVEFTLDGELYRLAREAPMNQDGYTFTVYPAANTEVVPRPGKFVSANPPSFAWTGTGDVDFQLASDINFNQLLCDVTVSDNQYAPSSALEVTDTSTFYWRIKPHGQASYDCLYAINLVATETGSCGDANQDGELNVGDAVFLINMIFKGGPAPMPACIGDASNDGHLDVGDAVLIVNYIFRGGPPPAEGCCP